jgi:MFS family permease
VPTQLPFVVQSMGGSGADAGMVMGVGPLVSAFTSLFYVKLRKYLNIRNVFVFVCIVQGIGLGAVGFASHLWQLYFPFIFLGIGNGFAFSNTSVWFLHIVAPAKRAKLSGILTGSFFLGQFCSPLFIQPFLDILHMPLNHVFTLYGGVLLVIAVLLFLFKPRLGNEANA